MDRTADTEEAGKVTPPISDESSKKRKRPDASVLIQTERGLAVRRLISGGGHSKKTFAADQSVEGAVRNRVMMRIQAVDQMAPEAQLETRILNGCGEFKGSLISRRPSHIAWQRVHTLFGSELHAYTADGNMSIQVQHMLFRGATDPLALAGTARRLFIDVLEAHPTPMLHLVVMQTAVRRSLFVHVGCLLDRQLEAGPRWLRPCGRCEELCNVVSFSIRSWKDAALDLPGFPSSLEAPNTATVSVTRRGVMTVRLTWVRGVEWTCNSALLSVADCLARFVHDLV